VNGTELREWMEQQGWSVRELAAEFEVSASTIQRWRDDEARIPRTAELALKVLPRKQ